MSIFKNKKIEESQTLESWERLKFDAYDTIGSYFPDGGETYTSEELSYKLMNDLGVSQEEVDIIIDKCLHHGFINQCGNNCYVR